MCFSFFHFITLRLAVNTGYLAGITSLGFCEMNMPFAAFPSWQGFPCLFPVTWLYLSLPAYKVLSNTLPVMRPSRLFRLALFLNTFAWFFLIRTTLIILSSSADVSAAFICSALAVGLFSWAGWTAVNALRTPHDFTQCFRAEQRKVWLSFGLLAVIVVFSALVAWSLTSFQSWPGIKSHEGFLIFVECSFYALSVLLLYFG